MIALARAEELPAQRDEDKQLRGSPQGIGGGTVIATLKAFIARAPSAITRAEAEKVLGELTEAGG